MIKRWLVIFALLQMLIVASPAGGYETETHALITQVAYQRSVLASSDAGSVVNVLGLDRLGITAPHTTPFRPYWSSTYTANYYYMDGGTYGTMDTFVDTPEAFERCQMQEFLPSPLNGSPPFQEYFRNTVSLESGDPNQDSMLPIQNWIVRGAIREDDMGSEGLGALVTWSNTSQTHCGLQWRATVQYGNYTRSLNHFYDPALNIGLSPCIPGATCQPSIDWALGYVDSFANPPQEDTSRRNRYSYLDARNTFYEALTRQYNRQLNAQANLRYTAAEREEDAVDRMYLWATMFRSLGDVLHLLEDTGQPQHTRNDPHGGPNTPEQQAFEGYTNDRVLDIAQK